MLIGSLCLSDIPRDVMKKIMCKDGKERVFLNIAICERKEVGQYGHTHFVSCAPKKEERREGEKYIIGDLKEWKQQPIVPTVEDIQNAPSVGDDDDLPF